MSMAWTCAAPLRASCTVSSPLPDPMSRQRWWAPTPSRYRYFQIRKLPWVGTNTPSSTSISGTSSGNISRPRGSAHDGASRRLPFGAVLRRRHGGPLVAGLGVGQRGPRRLQVLGPHAAAAADDLGALVAPAQRQLGVLRALDAGLVAPPRRGQVAEVGVDAERQVGEVAQPREHAGDVIGRDAVDGQRARPPSPRSAVRPGRRRRPRGRPSARRRPRTRPGGSAGSSATPGSPCPAAPPRWRRWSCAPATASPAGSGPGAPPRTRARAGRSSRGRRAYRRRR